MMTHDQARTQEASQDNADFALSAASRGRVMAFVDGFNVYHSLSFFDRGETEAEQTQYRQYKWLNLRKLLANLIDPAREELVRVLYFTAYPHWNPEKQFRHETYISALRTANVEVVFGEFKSSMIQCQVPKPPGCREFYASREEKQTDVNIAVSVIEFAGEYDRLLLVTADSDQVPTLRLLKKKHPEKHISVVHPIARRSKELEKCSDSHARITVEMLQDSQFDDPIQITRPSGRTSLIAKPNTWRS